MQIVIDIPEEQYKRICNHTDRVYDMVSLLTIIENGTLLPKGHGRLIDADKYLKSVCTYKETGCGSCKLQTMCPVDEPTIIEADKESDIGE